MERLCIKNSIENEVMINRPLAHLFLNELIQRNLQICIAEGGTGGHIFDQCTIPGSVRTVHMGGVFYSTASKINLGVSAKTISRFGEYSSETAVEMAQLLMQKSGADCGVATFGQLNTTVRSVDNYVCIAYVQRDRKPWVKKIILPDIGVERRLLKTMIAQSVFSHGLYFLKEDEKSFISDHVAIQFTEKRNKNPIIIENHVLARKILTYLQSRHCTLGTCESCTTASISNTFTDISGASEVFHVGWMANNERVKAMLGVSPELMKYGNVYSESVARSMAESIRKKHHLDFVIATTGTMDTFDHRPYHSTTKPGTVYVAIAGKDITVSTKLIVPCPFGHSREQVELTAISLILKYVNQQVCGIISDIPTP